MNILQFQYPFDPNGVLPSNLITNENHNITASSGLPYNFIIPRRGPYFANSLIVTHPSSGRTLDVGVDYVHSYLFQQQSATEPFLMVFGGISILTTEYDGSVLSLRYQTLGGEYVLPETDILAILANAHIDPRLTTWDTVALKPGEYHPDAHLHHVSSTMGWDDLVLAVRDLIEKIRVESGELAALFQLHIDDLNNPHETNLLKLGIERFANVYKATLAQANIGTDDINYITPFLLRDVLNNTDLLTKDRVGLGLVENFPPATSTEILLGTIGRYVTADLLKEYYARKNGEGASGLWDISILGNAETSTRLLTPRLINRRPFDGTSNLEVSEWYHSNRDFIHGTLVTTDIDYAATHGDVWCIEITGNPYVNGAEAIDTKAFGYNYNNTIISVGGHHNGYLMSGIVAMNVGGNLCFWWPPYGYWQGFNVRVYVAGGHNAQTHATNQNRVISITDSVDPGGTKRVNISDSIRTQPVRIGDSATMATRLQNARLINGTSFDGTANITTNEWGTTRNITVGLTTRPVNGASNVSWSLADIGALPLTGGTTTGFVNLAGSAGVPLNISFLFNSQNTGLGWGIQETSADGFLRFQTREGTGSWTNRLVLASDAVTSMNPITAPNFIGAVTGNASTATALQTARLINGTSFDGTANITTERWGTNRDITIGVTTRSVNGSANVSWTLTDIGAPSVTGVGATGTWNIGITGPVSFTIPSAGRSNGLSWSGLSDQHHIFAEKYGESESTRLVIENSDNAEDYTLFRHMLSGGIFSDTFEIRRGVVRTNVFFEHVGMNRISDGTLKLNKTEVDYDDFDIDQLSLMNWIWSDDDRVPAELRGKPGQGVIAQDVQRVFPDCVQRSEQGILRVDDAALATKLSIILLKKLKKLGL